MERLKKFGIYILILLALYVFVSIVSFGFIQKSYKKIDKYEILTTSPKIEIIESKSTYVNGYVLAKITNNTGQKIDKTYVKIDLYTENDNYLGTKYNEIKDFGNNDVVEVKTNYKFNGVDHYKINLVNSIASDSLYDDNEEITYVFFNLLGFASIIMLLYYIF